MRTPVRSRRVSALNPIPSLKPDGKSLGDAKRTSQVCAKTTVGVGVPEGGQTGRFMDSMRESMRVRDEAKA